MRERGREVCGVSGASRRKQEVARGKQEVAEASRARATPRLCLLAEEDDRGGSGDGLGRAGPGKWAPGKSRWVLSLLFSISFCFLVFLLFVLI